jgi:glycosyltransferase involved in cell wall biosynthesis
MCDKRYNSHREKKQGNLNIIFLSFRKTFFESAGAKRTYYQASFLNRFEDVTYLIPKKGINKNDNNIPTCFGKWSTIVSLIKLRNRHKKNILIIGTLITLKEFPYLMCAKILGYKIVLDKVENYKYFEDKKSFGNWINIEFGLLLDKWLNFFADGLLVISSKLNELYAKNNLPVLFMPNSIPIDKINYSSKQQFSKPVKILYSGTFGQKEGIELLVRAFLKINTNYKNVELHLVGKGTIYNENRIKKEIKDNNHIIWHGYVTNKRLNKLQIESDILMMTRIDSKFAQFGFPYKVTEYLTTGNTIIATNVGDIGNFLLHKVSAVITEPNVKAIYESIVFCLKNNQEALNIGKNGQIHALKAFNIDLNGKKLINFLKYL